ncbi:hypothetical protein [Kitasatospora sp. KL5]|uniref:hypothetical protein n=1 Tax=Kitasatospora sp. KL5 TaxID=3425125 RepID=UPI003D6F7A99
MAHTARVHRLHISRDVLVPAAALVLLGGAAGCGTGSRTPAGAGSGVTVASSVASSAQATASAALLTASQLQAALLTAAELGPAFTVSSSPVATADSRSEAVAGCEPLAGMLNGAPSTTQQVHQNVLLTAGDTGPFVAESLLTESPEALTSDYAQARGALASCRTLIFPTAAEPLVFTLSPINFGGPGSTAARMDATYRGVQVNGYLAIERLGPVALTFAYFQVGSGSSQLASAYYRQAVDKIHQALGPTTTAQPTN